jgi:Zn-dependent protease with chaperone function
MGDRLKTGARLVLVLFGIPCLGWFCATRFRGMGQGTTSLLERLSVDTAAAMIAVLLLVWLTARLAQNNRALLASVFGAEIRLVLALTCLLIPAQGWILILSALVFGRMLPAATQLYVLAPVCFGVVSGLIGMLLATVQAIRLPPQEIIGRAMARAEQPRLWALVDQVGEQIGADPPDRLILGLEATFFATGGRVRLNGDRSILSGETLFIAVPLLRLLSPLELRAVIGHELGHFKGLDTVYSQRFVPIYRGLAGSLHRLDATRGFARIVTLPAMAVIEFCLHIFSRAERGISRAREIEADRLGALAASPHAIVATLVKLAAFHRAWIEANQINLSFLDSGRVLDNIADAFEEQAGQVRRSTSAAALLDGTRDLQQPHPTDTHPTLEARAAALGVDLTDADALLMLGKIRAIDLMDEADALETSLTRDYQRWLLAKGYAKLP